MDATLAEATFIGLRADAWSAIGLWITIGGTLLLAVFAYSQVKEAQTLRREQTRPFVIVDIVFDGVIMYLSIRNVGPTAARDVQINFDEPLTSTVADPDWQLSSAFTRGIPMMAPGREIRFMFDSYITRSTSELPTIIAGSVRYGGPIDHGHRSYSDPFTIDLTVFEGSRIPPDGFPELVAEVKQIRAQFAKWTEGIRGLRVTVHRPERPRLPPRIDEPGEAPQ